MAAAQRAAATNGPGPDLGPGPLLLLVEKMSKKIGKHIKIWDGFGIVWG